MNIFANLLHVLADNYDESCAGSCFSTCNGVSLEHDTCNYGCILSCTSEVSIEGGCSECAGLCSGECVLKCQRSCSDNCDKKEASK